MGRNLSLMYNSDNKTDKIKEFFNDLLNFDANRENSILLAKPEQEGDDKIKDAIKSISSIFGIGSNNKSNSVSNKTLKKLNFGKKATKANNTKSNNIAGYINGIPVKEASAYAKAWDKRRVNEEHILGLMQDLLGMTGWLPNQTQNTNNIDIPLPTMPNRKYDNSFGGRLAKAIDMKNYANQLRAYTELNKARILASSRVNNSNRVTNFLNLYKTLIPETESLNPNSAYSSKGNMTTKDKISLLSALTKGLVNPATNTLDTNAYKSVLGSLFPNLTKNIKLQPSITGTTKEQDKEREKRLKAITQTLGR